MKKIAKTASPEPKEEAQEILNYKEDLKEIKELLNVIAERLLELKITGGF
jgi:hypothetical protein